MAEYKHNKIQLKFLNTRTIPFCELPLLSDKVGFDCSRLMDGVPSIIRQVLLLCVMCY